MTKIEVQSQERRNKRQKRFESVKGLHKLGLSKSEITYRLNLNWRTIDKYIRVAECPFGGHKDSSILDLYMDYMIKRWEEGCHNATHIWREIQDNAPLSASSAAWLLAKQEEKLTEEDNNRFSV